MANQKNDFKDLMLHYHLSDGIHFCVHRELTTELSVPLTSLINFVNHFAPVSFLNAGNSQMCVLFRNLGIVLRCRIVLFLFYVRLKNRLKELSSNTFTITFMIIIPNSLRFGFIPGDSTFNQLVYLYNYLYNAICQALDTGKEVKVVFCDISKNFDRVWLGLLLKLEAVEISGSFDIT